MHKHEAPPIIGPIDFAGMENSIILVEHSHDDDSLALISGAINDKVNIIFSPSIDITTSFRSINSAVVFCDSIAMVCRIAKRLPNKVDYIIINRIDMFDLNFNKKEKGAQTKAYVSMMASKKTLNGANLIVTSGKTEYTLRDIADKFLNLN